MTRRDRRRQVGVAVGRARRGCRVGVLCAGALLAVFASTPARSADNDPRRVQELGEVLKVMGRTIYVSFGSSDGVQRGDRVTVLRPDFEISTRGEIVEVFRDRAAVGLDPEAAQPLRGYLVFRGSWNRQPVILRIRPLVTDGNARPLATSRIAVFTPEAGVVLARGPVDGEGMVTLDLSLDDLAAERGRALVLITGTSHPPELLELSRSLRPGEGRSAGPEQFVVDTSPSAGWLDDLEEAVQAVDLEPRRVTWVLPTDLGARLCPILEEREFGCKQASSLSEPNLALDGLIVLPPVRGLPIEDLR